VGDKPVSDIELASLLNVSVDTVKKIEKNALGKLKRNESFASMKTEDGPLVDEIDNSSYKIHKQ
jgi:DNA-directed RNA polymerase sigma subunit (sigma70/sigma32)